MNCLYSTFSHSANETMCPFLLGRTGVFSKTAVQGDSVAGKLVKAVPGHALLFFLLLFRRHTGFLEGCTIGSRGLRVLWRSLDARFEFRLSVEARGAVSVWGGLYYQRWGLWGSNLEGEIIDRSADHFKDLLLFVGEILQPGVLKRTSANVPLDHHQNYHEKRAAQNCKLQGGETTSQTHSIGRFQSSTCGEKTKNQL